MLPGEYIVETVSITVSIGRFGLLNGYNFLLSLIGGNYEGAAVFLFVTQSIHINFDYYLCDRHELFSEFLPMRKK